VNGDRYISEAGDFFELVKLCRGFEIVRCRFKLVAVEVTLPAVLVLFAELTLRIELMLFVSSGIGRA